MPINRFERGMQPDVRTVTATDRREGLQGERTVLILKGQGFVRPGMGRELYNNFKSVRELHSRTNGILGWSLTDKIFNDPDGDLLETQNAQPATILTNYAQQLAGKEAGHPDFKQPVIYSAGNSLGEYSAAIAMGAISYEGGIRLIAKRGQFMHEAHMENPGRLATPLLSRDNEEKREEQMGLVDEVRRETGIVVCLVNSKTQIVYGGTNEEMDAATALLRDKRIKLTPLKTIGAFHHPRLMLPARRELEPEIDAAEIHDVTSPIIANTTATEIKTAEEIRTEFKAQMTSPVLWMQSMNNLENKGFDVRVELGEKSSFLDMLLDHPVYDGIALSAVVAGGVTLGWKLAHPHNRR